MSLVIIIIYFSVLLYVTFLTNRKITGTSFFNANRQSKWYLVAFGMIGTSLSGITFISVPGWVNTNYFFYLQMVMGYVVGYFIIAYVLIPLYYRRNLVSIYGYLNSRFGFWGHKSGACFFLISRVLGASLRLFIVVIILRLFLADIGIGFHGSVLITIALIWLYTFRGGIKTIVYTDVLQTSVMLIVLVITIHLLMKDLGINIFNSYSMVRTTGYTKVFDWDITSSTYFWKHFLAGAFITIAMTGLDQDIMQKKSYLQEYQRGKEKCSFLYCYASDS